MLVRLSRSTAGNLLVLVLSLVLSEVARAQEISPDGDQILKAPLQPLQPLEENRNLDTVMLVDAKCDNPMDGALIGGLIGSSPLILALLLAERDARGERYIPLAYVGFLGGVAGFFIGLGVDEARCHNGETFESDSLSSDQSQSANVVP